MLPREHAQIRASCSPHVAERPALSSVINDDDVVAADGC
jgi:hypothetical protein